MFDSRSGLVYCKSMKTTHIKHLGKDFSIIKDGARFIVFCASYGRSALPRPFDSIHELRAHYKFSTDQIAALLAA